MVSLNAFPELYGSSNDSSLAGMVQEWSTLVFIEEEFCPGQQVNSVNGGNSVQQNGNGE